MEHTFVLKRKVILINSSWNIEQVQPVGFVHFIPRGFWWKGVDDVTDYKKWSMDTFADFKSQQATTIAPFGID